MVSATLPSEAYLPGSVTRSVKILVVGPFAVGKTTFVSTMSEIRPLYTEESMTAASEPVDDLDATPGKTTTTVALDFGRRTLNDQLVMYLFGTPGQGRFEYLWRDLARGALGALVLADTRRLDASFAAVDVVEGLGLRYAVGINQFDGAARHPESELREALDLTPETPLVTCDARDHSSCTHALITLMQYLLTTSGPRGALL
ncbi:ATP-binding protein [Amycolatopsis antarctica]|uniref:ATP-binding protein n=1 Tax=Amycolatopsis antarctica TaxID=1854586 RepID=A0A263D4H5_9PSEU|nr:ATP/GTP-binding protein [Amycolatopsis antarctica]OZM72265.1 ATP-binding protein [Amycolatopsis antarctica]